MTRQNSRIMKHAQVSVEGNVMRCENHTLRMDGITQIWTGKRQEKRELTLSLTLVIVLVNMVMVHAFNDIVAVLAALASIVLIMAYMHQGNENGLHVELYSGDVYSFISDNRYFVSQVYELLGGIISGKKDKISYTIIFDGNGSIVDHLEREEPEKEPEAEEPEPVPVKKAVAERSYGVNDQLIEQLQTLYTFYNEKEDKNEEALSVINEIIQKTKKNDLINIKELYGKFIALGLINECNDLGLNALIGEVKRHIF